ncbi:hypothetical protein LCL63_001708 [Vibrio fluvialis]|nr:hypothetical protein [Vibrio fluvialis]
MYIFHTVYVIISAALGLVKNKNNFMSQYTNQHLTLYGTHGTCVSRADSIMKDGFDRLGVGRHGTGVYVWYGKVKHSDKAKLLGKCYADEARGRGEYKDEKDKSTSVIECEIHTQSESFVDLTDEDTHDLFQEYARANENILRNSKYGDYKQRAAKVADGFIHDLEVETGRKVEVVKTRTVAPESYVGKYCVPGNWLDWNKATCLVVYSLDTIKKELLEKVL